MVAVQVLSKVTPVYYLLLLQPDHPHTMDLWLLTILVTAICCLALTLVGILIIWRCRNNKVNFKEEEEEQMRDEKEDVDNQDVFGSAENFLIGWSERRNKNGRYPESGKVFNSQKLDNIETGQEETYESFTLKEEDSETDEEILTENETTLLLEPDNDLSNDVMKDIVITDNVKVKIARRTTGAKGFYPVHNIDTT